MYNSSWSFSEKFLSLCREHRDIKAKGAEESDHKAFSVALDTF